MNSWKIILAVVVIFGAGVITGGLLVNHVPGRQPGHVETSATEPNAHPVAENRGPARPPEVPLPRLAERLSKEWVRRLDKSLHLTMAQSNSISKIVADGQERNHVIWTNVAPEMRKVIEDVNQQIRAELTPEQLKKFEELMKQSRPAGHRPQPQPGSRASTNEPPMVAPTNPPPGV
jgi:hypothetical protein